MPAAEEAEGGRLHWAACTWWCYAPFGLLKRAIWPQMNDQLPLLHVSSVIFPWRAMQLIEESASLWKRLHCCAAV